MKTRTSCWHRISHGALVLVALLGGIFAVPSGRAQPATPAVDSRFLFVFDTSAEMKRRLPAVKGALAALLATGASGQIRSNDSIGVWTFDQELHAGQFPLQRWQPDKAVLIASNISTFVSGQRYSKTTGFDALVPALNQIMQHSERLTVVIFCDGYGEVHGTPYDTGINQIFKQRQDERQKSRQPIAVALRSQLGQYVDCMVSFPPQAISLPVFPPLPPPEPPPVKVAPPPPRPVVAPLIIIGTPPTNRVPASLPPASAPAPKPTPSNPPPVSATPTPAAAVAHEAGSPVMVPMMSTSTIPVQLKIDAAVLSQTNIVAPPAEDSGTSHLGALAMGVAFLAVAAGLTVFLIRYTRSVKKD